MCGHGPSGRNGGFCETLWPDAAILREHAGDEAALAVCRASEDAVRGIGAWCEAQGIDAWYRAAPMLRVATTESQMDSWAEVVRAARELGEADEVVALSADEVRAQLRLAALPRRLPLPAERHRAACPARPWLAREAAGARHTNLRAHPRHEVATRGRRRDQNRRGPRGRHGARGQLADICVPRIPPLARCRLEPHRAHRARSGGHRGSGLDRRRGDRRQPDTRPLHANHARRADRLRLGRRHDGVRREGRTTAGARSRRSSRARASRSSASFRSSAAAA